MPRHPDPDLEQRILNAADVLWRKGGTRALTMRAVARAAGTNTPAVYRRFKNREDLIKGILLRSGTRVRQRFEQGRTLEDMADQYVQFALENPHEYELFHTESHLLNPRPKKPGAPIPPIRESRPNFGFAERVAATELGGKPEEYTELALALWAIAHGTAMLLLKDVIPEAHSATLRNAFRSAVKAIIEKARSSRRR